MIRKILKTDKNIYFDMVKEFYNSPAVLHSIPDSFIQNTFEEMMKSDTYLDCYILQTDIGEIAGYALLVKCFTQEAGGRVVWLDEFYIRKEHRNKGLGSEFLSYLTNNIPASRYRLEVEPENIKAKELYSRNGFVNLGYEQLVKDNR